MSSLDNLPADAFLRDGQLNLAIRSYRKAISANPHSAWSHHGLGEASARKGWFLLARSLFRRALELDPEEVKRWQAANLPDFDTRSSIPEPVFVLGCPHSGTTIITRLLGEHPNIMKAELRETQLFSRDPATIQSTLRQWDRNCIEAGKRRWIEKSVIHTFMVPKLLAARPGARLIIMVRDGRDVVASMKTRKYAFAGFDELVNSWTKANDVLREVSRRSQAMLIRYEDLVREPESTLRKLCDHLGEPFSEKMLEHHCNRIEWNGVEPEKAAGELGDVTSHRHLRAWQINQPLFDGRGRWQHELSDEEKARLKDLALNQLVEFGYVSDDNW